MYLITLSLTSVLSLAESATFIYIKLFMLLFHPAELNPSDTIYLSNNKGKFICFPVTLNKFKQVFSEFLEKMCIYL